MSTDWEALVRSPGILGVGYLVGVGLALVATLVGYAWFTRESALVIFVSVAIPTVLFATVGYVGFLSWNMGLSERFVRSVGRWAAIGFGFAVLLSLGIAAISGHAPNWTLPPSFIVLTVATFGVIGTLVGVVSGLRQQHERLREVTHRNAVMNRVLRHNIKNAMNVISGHASILAEEANGRAEQSRAAIDRAVDEVVSLSETARDVDALGADGRGGPIDLSTVAGRVIDNARETYPEATFTADLPAACWADAGGVIRPAVVNVIENAVEHHDGAAEIRVSVEATGDSVVLRIADDGPGIPQGERRALSAERPAQIDHGNGLGLWLVKWVVDHFDGEVRFEENEPRGTVVALRLPAADAPAAAVPRA